MFCCCSRDGQHEWPTCISFTYMGLTKHNTMPYISQSQAQKVPSEISIAAAFQGNQNGESSDCKRFRRALPQLTTPHQFDYLQHFPLPPPPPVALKEVTKVSSSNSTGPLDLNHQDAHRAAHAGLSLSMPRTAAHLFSIKFSAILKNASSTFSAVLALVSKNGICSSFAWPCKWRDAAMPTQ